jgi:hypothetical protein
MARRSAWLSGQRRSKTAPNDAAPKTCPPETLAQKQRLPSREKIHAGIGDRSSAFASGSAPNSTAVSRQDSIKWPSPPPPLG